MATVHQAGDSFGKNYKIIGSWFFIQKETPIASGTKRQSPKTRADLWSWLLELMPFGIGKRFLIDNLKNHVELSAAFITEIEFKTADEKWSSCWNSISWLKCLVMTITLDRVRYMDDNIWKKVVLKQISTS